MRILPAALLLLAVAACDGSALDEVESGDLGTSSAELVIGSLPYDTPYTSRLYASGRYAYHWYLLDTQPGDALELSARFAGARGFVTFAELTDAGVSFDLCAGGARNGCQSLEVPDRGQYLVLVTTADRWFRGVPTAARYEVEVRADAGRQCGVSGTAPCGDDEFCSFPREAICGAADRPGYCESIPTACTEQFQPVESCDGTVYCNPCYAAAWGASVIADAPASAPGDIVCSFPGSEGPFPGETTCSTASPCGAFEVCDYSGVDLLECPASYDGLVGVCRNPAVTLCPATYDPVCGCDGETYSNRCLLGLRTGVAIAAPGECPPS